MDPLPPDPHQLHYLLAYWVLRTNQLELTWRTDSLPASLDMMLFRNNKEKVAHYLEGQHDMMGVLPQMGVFGRKCMVHGRIDCLGMRIMTE